MKKLHSEHLKTFLSFKSMSAGSSWKELFPTIVGMLDREGYDYKKIKISYLFFKSKIVNLHDPYHLVGFLLQIQ